MRDSKRRADEKPSRIKCIEVLISRKAIAENGHNLLWTLSVYSLENHPVTKGGSLDNSDIFHFMVYDWTRTIKQLLVHYRIPYEIIQHFTPVSIYSGERSDLGFPENQPQFFSPFNFVPTGGAVPIQESRDSSETKRRETTDVAVDAHSV